MLGNKLSISHVISTLSSVTSGCCTADYADNSLKQKYYLNPTTSRLSLLHKSETKPRMTVNNNDNLRVQWDLSGFYPILLMCTTMASVYKLPLFFEVKC